MSVLPVIARELRSQARQPITYWLRIVGGLTVTAAVVIALWRMKTAGEQFRANPFGFPTRLNPVLALGTALFGRMNLFIFFAIWIFVPLASADAVSRERREGTLPLLYLTELRSFGIVIGKAFAHMLRSATLFLTMTPWLMLPLILGSVSLQEVRMALLLNLASLFLAQAAGLLASAIPRDRLKSAILAQLFAVPLLLLLLHAHGGVLRSAIAAGSLPGIVPGSMAYWNSPAVEFVDFYNYMSHQGILSRTGALVEYATNSSLDWREDWFNAFVRGPAHSTWHEMLASLTPAGQDSWQSGIIVLVIASGLVLCVAACLGAWRVEKSWQDSPAPLWVSQLRQRFFSPQFAVPWLHRNLSRSLTANPIGWLQQYSPSARMVKWSWCLFILIVEIILSGDASGLFVAQNWLSFLLLLGLTFSATGSFRRELETGAFELWLVTPLRERQIITGRLRGLWRQFLPALLLLSAASIYLKTGWSGVHSPTEVWRTLASVLALFLTLPVIGLYFSVSRWNFFIAWLAACLVGLLPAILGRVLNIPDIPVLLFQLLVAFVAAIFLELRLRNREFLQQRSATSFQN